jgi:hypothetical protein
LAAIGLPCKIAGAIKPEAMPADADTDGADLVDGTGTVQNNGDPDVVGGEASLDKVLNTPITTTANFGLTPNDLIDPDTGQIDYTRASWSRASWSQAADPLRASWSRASWSATPQSCTDFERASWSRASWSSDDIAMAQAQCANLLAKVDSSRASWSRASWSRASWSTSFDK